MIPVKIPRAQTMTKNKNTTTTRTSNLNSPTVRTPRPDRRIPGAINADTNLTSTIRQEPPLTLPYHAKTEKGFPGNPQNKTLITTTIHNPKQNCFEKNEKQLVTTNPTRFKTAYDPNKGYRNNDSQQEKAAKQLLKNHE